MRTAHQHSVKFYATEESLYATVGTFLGQALYEGDPAILIATPAHRIAMLHHLRDRMIDVERAERSGSLLLVDAHDALSQFMIGDAPDERAFDRSIGSMVDHMVSGRSRKHTVCAYGEMVDVLWQGGQSDAAIRLEMLWNRLSARHGMSLLCGYSMGNFFKETSGFEQVCAQHTHVVPPN